MSGKSSLAERLSRLVAEKRGKVGIRATARQNRPLASHPFTG